MLIHEYAQNNRVVTVMDSKCDSQSGILIYTNNGQYFQIKDTNIIFSLNGIEFISESISSCPLIKLTKEFENMKEGS